MKQLLIVLSVLGLSSTALASPVVERVTQKTVILERGPHLPGGPVVTTTSFHVVMESCGGLDLRRFNVDLEERHMGLSNRRETFVTIEYPNFIDCTGPTFARRYIVETREIARGKRYLLTNPTVLKVESQNIR